MLYLSTFNGCVTSCSLSAIPNCIPWHPPEKGVSYLEQLIVVQFLNAEGNSIYRNIMVETFLCNQEREKYFFSCSIWKISKSQDTHPNLHLQNTHFFHVAKEMSI